MPSSGRLSAPILLGLLMSGCISVGDFSRSATRYNEAVEEAQNRMLLLNIVRANLSRPMYITDLSKVTGNIKIDFNTGGIESAYGPYTSDLIKGKGFLTSGKLTPSLDYAHNPTFDVNVLSTQEFMNGFLKPTSKELLAYYWEQRWEQELLLYLFVHSVRVRSVDDTTEPEEYYENYPRADTPERIERFEAFGRWVTRFLKTKPHFVRKNASIGPCLERKEVRYLDDLVATAKEGLSLTEVEQGEYQLQQAKPDLSLTSEEEDELAQEQDAICKASKSKDLEIAAADAKKECETKLAKEKESLPSRLQHIKRICSYRNQIYTLVKKKKFECASPCPDQKGDNSVISPGALALLDTRVTTRAQMSATYVETGVKKEATLFLRAPEGILYYLGELMRAEERERFVPEICIEGHLEPLFVAFTRSKPGDNSEKNCPAIVSVQYDESEFIIPNARRDSPAPATGDFKCPKDESEDTDQQQAWRESGRKYIQGLENLNCSSGRSMQALSLLTQLIALQKSAKDAPTTTVIRAISQ